MSRRQQIESMLADDPKDSFLRYALALEWASEHRLEQAVGVLQELVSDDPTYIPAHLQLGQLLVKAGIVDKARATLQSGIAAARNGNDDHAAEEMAALLATLGEV